MLHQESVGQISSAGNKFSPNPVNPKVNVSDLNIWAQVQQISYSGYALASEHYPQLQQLLQQQQQQLAHPQKFISAGSHFVHFPAAAAPLSTYYPLFASQHPQLDQQYPFYYIRAAQPHAYGLPAQQTNFSEAASAIPSNYPQAPPNHTMITTSTVYDP
ncbi:hypothetical protein Nepgr_029329 [Nepenthes gracilis]|uniref:Uncharacterized protein n=1 Tax=Nepenthes gracilis TaxID=150966 RepID=A0AAD3TER0_NEPGR|nr:hypothetical protein Nepgr_029329 [Nepenthes gracilis]